MLTKSQLKANLSKNQMSKILITRRNLTLNESYKKVDKNKT